jgi:uncharacterized protein (TIGR03067 family)
MKKALLGVFVIGLLLAADEKKADDPKDKLKGTWTVVSMEIDGKKAPEADVKGQTLTFEGDKCLHKGKDKTEKAGCKIDATKKPAEMDITPEDGPDKGKVMKMIFQLDGDNLKIAGTEPGKDRPKSFDDKGIMVIVLKREKK